MKNNLTLAKIVKPIGLILMPLLHSVLFMAMLYQGIYNKYISSRYIIAGIFVALFAVPILISKSIFKSFRSQLEFCLISYITSFALCVAFFQINSRSDITTSIPLVDGLGLGISWGSQLALLMLSFIALGIFFDLLYGRYITDFRLSFTSTFALQLILCLGVISYMHLISLGKFDERYYKVVWLDLLVNMPYWFLTLVFASVSAFITIFYFGRGNVLHHQRPTWAKIGWRLLIIAIHFQLAGMIMLLPQNYWWKVLFYILIWDFIAIPLSRIYKQSTDFFWDRLKVSLIYHLILFSVVFWISYK